MGDHQGSRPGEGNGDRYPTPSPFCASCCESADPIMASCPEQVTPAHPGVTDLPNPHTNTIETRRVLSLKDRRILWR